MGECISVTRHHVSGVATNDDREDVISNIRHHPPPAMKSIFLEASINESSAISASKPETPTNIVINLKPSIYKTDVIDNKQNGHDSISIEGHGTDETMDDNSSDDNSKHSNDLNVKHVKLRCNPLIKHYKTSSSEPSEIKDQEASDSHSKSKKLKKYRFNKPLKHYGSSSSEQSLIDIKDCDSDSVGSYFESITKLTTITNMALENMNGSSDGTMIEKKTISTLSSVTRCGGSADNGDSIESIKGSSLNQTATTSLQLNDLNDVSSSGPQIKYNNNNVSSSGPQIKYNNNNNNNKKIKLSVNEQSSSGPHIKYIHNRQCPIQNPFYHSDNTDTDDNDDDDDDDDSESFLSDDTGSCTSYNWYQSFDGESIDKARKLHITRMRHNVNDINNINNINNINVNSDGNIIKIKQNSGRDKIKRIKFHSKKKQQTFARSMTITPTNTNHNYPDWMIANKSSSFNSIRAQISSSNISMDTTIDPEMERVHGYDNDNDNNNNNNDDDNNPFCVAPIIYPPPVNTPIHSSDTDMSDCIDTTITDIEFSQNGGGIILPIQWLNKKRVTISPYYQYTHYNTINGWYEQSEKQRSRQISIQRNERRVCLPPQHSFNYLSNNENDKSDFDEDDVASIPSQHSTHF